MFNRSLFNAAQFNVTQSSGSAALSGGSALSAAGQTIDSAQTLLLNGVTTLSAVGNDILVESETFPGVSSMNAVGDVIANGGNFILSDTSSLALTGVTVAVLLLLRGEGFLSENIYVFEWTPEGEPASTWNLISQTTSNWIDVSEPSDQWKKVNL